MRANQSERLAAETDKQRKARLQRVRANQSERLAAETEEQREARLQRMRANQVRDWLLRLNSRERPGYVRCTHVHTYVSGIPINASNATFARMLCCKTWEYVNGDNENRIK